MTSQNAQLVLRDVDTSQDLKSMKMFKFRKEDKKRLTEEVACVAKKFKDRDIVLISGFVGKSMLDSIFSMLVVPRVPISYEPDFCIFDEEKVIVDVRGHEVDWAPFQPISIPVPRRGSSELEAFERERQAFLEAKDSLLDNPEFRGKFVAIYEGKIVDQDEDNRELAKRVYRRHGYVPIYIGKVERERRIIEMPSPEGS